MQIHYDVDRIKRTLQNLSKLTGISLAFMNMDQEYLCFCCPSGNFCAALLTKDSSLRRLCWDSDQLLLTACQRSLLPEQRICHAGLLDAIVPTVKDGTVVGYVVPGRIRTPSSVLPEIYREDPRLVELWYALPCYSEEQIQSLVDLLPSILLGSAIEISSGGLAFEVAAYMKERMTQKMDLEHLCNRFFVSKNTLYRAFRESYGTTANQYLTFLRMDRAKHLLTTTQLTVTEVALAVGIEDYHYFCRMFTRHTGCAPGAFRRQAQTKLTPSE